MNRVDAASASICPSATIDAVAHYLPHALVAPTARQGLREIAAALPACAESVGFECVLGAENDSVDLGVSVTPRNGGRSILCGDVSDARLAHCVDADERWRRLQAFARWWADPASDLEMRIPFLFLEFDSDGPRTPVPIPSVFVALDWPLDELTTEARQRYRTEGPDSDPGLHAAKDIIHRLRGRLPDPDTNRLLDRCFLQVPDGGVILHVAVMLSRPGEGVRLSVQLPRRDVARYLGDLDWPGVDTLERFLDEHATHADFEHPAARIQIDVDIGSAIGERIGITLRPGQERGWSSLLDPLAEARLCEPAKRDALLVWPGISVAQLPGAPGPCLLEHYIAHLKMSCAVNQEPRAKAYFGVTPRWPEGRAPLTKFAARASREV